MAMNVTSLSAALSTVAMTSTNVPETVDGCMRVSGDFDPQDNPDNIITKETAFWLSNVNSVGVIPTLFIVGVPGNLFSAAVFYRLGLKERINLCVFYLAIVDLVTITVTFLLTAEQVYRDLFAPSGFFLQYFTGLTGFTWVSMFLSAVIASERCFCVVSPLRAQRMLKTSTMGIFITVTSMILLAGMLTIAGPKHVLACVFDPKTNTTSSLVYVTTYYKENKEILDLFDVFLYATALPAIFLITIVVTTTITAAKLRSAMKWRQNTSSASRSSGDTKESREEALTKMLVATSLLFMVCLSPMLIVQIAMFMVEGLNYGEKYHNLVSVLWSYISVFRCINSSLNFFVYFRMGSRFRETLKHLLPCTRVKISTYVAKEVSRMDTGSKADDVGKTQIHAVTKY